MLLDGDLGLANVDVLLGLTPRGATTAVFVDATRSSYLVLPVIPPKN